MEDEDDGDGVACADGETDFAGNDCYYDGGPADGSGGGDDSGAMFSVTVTAVAPQFTFDGLWAAFIQFLQQYPITASWTIPIPNTLDMFGVQLAGAFLPQSNLLCGSLSLAFGLPGSASGGSIGTLLSTDPGAVISSFSGLGFGLGLTPPVSGLLGANGLGIQYGSNGVWGPTLTTKGSTATAGYGACWQTGSWNLVTSASGLTSPFLPPLAPKAGSPSPPAKPPTLPRLSQ